MFQIPNHQPDRWSKQTLNIYWTCLIYSDIIFIYMSILQNHCEVIVRIGSRSFQTDLIPNFWTHHGWKTQWLVDYRSGKTGQWITFIFIIYIYMYVYTYWFRFHLPGSNASAHIKLMCSFILLQDVKPPGDWLDVAFQKAQWQWANPQSYSLILHTESSPLGKPSPSSSGLCILTKGTIPKPSGKWLKFTPWSIAEHIHI